MVKSVVNDYSQITVINSDSSKFLNLKKKNKHLKKANKSLQEKIDNEYIHIREFKKVKSILQKQMMRFKFNRFLNLSRKKKVSLKEKNQSQNTEQEDAKQEEEEVEQEQEEDEEQQEQDDVEENVEDYQEEQQEEPVDVQQEQVVLQEFPQQDEEKIVPFQESFSERFQSFLLLTLVLSIVFAVLTNDTTHLSKYMKSFIIMFHWEKVDLSQIVPILCKHTGISVLIAMVYYGIISLF